MVVLIALIQVTELRVLNQICINVLARAFALRVIRSVIGLVLVLPIIPYY